MADVTPNALPLVTTTASTDVYIKQNGSTGVVEQVTSSNMLPADTVTPEKLKTGAGTSWTWQPWSPTWTNLSVGNGTQVAKYIQIGKTVQLRIHLTLGSTSTVSANPYFSLPLNWISDYVVRTPIGTVHYEDVGNAGYEGGVVAGSLANHTGLIGVHAAGAPYVQGTSVTATIPFTFGTGDQILIQATYEAA